MKEYKEYMDRIRVDETQHERFLKAMREAEAAGKTAAEQNTANRITEPAEEKKKVFRLSPRFYKVGGIAVAAVLAVVLLLGPGRSYDRSSSPQEDSHAATTDASVIISADVKNAAEAGDSNMAEKTENPAESPISEQSTAILPPKESEKRGAEAVPAEQVPVEPAAAALSLFICEEDGTVRQILSREENDLVTEWVDSGILKLFYEEAVSDSGPVWESANTMDHIPPAESDLPESAALSSQGWYLSDEAGNRYSFDLTGTDPETLQAVRRFLSDHGLTIAE